jgi:hypothetical protein
MKKQRQVPDLGFSETNFSIPGYCFGLETLDDTWTFRDAWWMKNVYGAPGSAQHFAEQLQNSLTLKEILPFFGRGAPLEVRKEIRHNYRIAIGALIHGDAKFYRMLADGLEASERSDPRKSRDPRMFLRLAYRYCRNQNPNHQPTKSEVIERTKWIWALVRLKGVMSALGVLDPPQTLDLELERQIAAEIEALPQVKWSRLFKGFGEKLSSTKPGPKKHCQLAGVPVC